MSITQRDDSLSTFRQDRECNVLLGSIAAAGVGIDLRCAQNVYIMVSNELLPDVWDVVTDSMKSQEPSWNPAMEAQAIDRLYRLGQVNPVNVYRYYVHGTLEMNIHQVQRRKGELALYVFQYH